ncbi:MAG: ABC transporter related protein, partial [uncultured bacterium]
IVILTSHDRFFLDKTVKTILEIKDGNVKTYGGNYSFYKKQKQDEFALLEKMYVVQQKKIHKIEENIAEFKQRALEGELTYTSRNPYQKKKAGMIAKTALVRERKLEKLLASEETLEKPKGRKKFGVDISGSAHSGKLILEVTGCAKSFGEKQIFKDVSFSIRGNEHVWLIGKNGSGKTTLLKIITGNLQPDFGEVRLGNGVRIGYFSQESTLNSENTGINELKLTGADETTCFNTASHLHLVESDLRKKIKQLSRGQLAKLEFVKILLSDINLLILDEPTNHLEIETREDIENALSVYKGAILVVSHDRYFVETIGVDQVVELR